MYKFYEALTAAYHMVDAVCAQIWLYLCECISVSVYVRVCTYGNVCITWKCFTSMSHALAGMIMNPFPPTNSPLSADICLFIQR